MRRVVHCSTVGVHGDITTPPANEDAPLAPGDLYQETKLEGERVGREAAARVGMELVIARPTGIYGPGDRRLFKVFGKVATRRFVMLGPGTHFYHVTYIDDLCAGFRLCASVPAAAGRTYILGGGEVTTLRELVGRTAEVAGVPAPRWRLPVWPVWLAGAACEGDLHAARDVAADLSAPCRLLPQEPRVRHRSRAPGTGLQPERRTARRHPPHVGVVP